MLDKLTDILEDIVDNDHILLFCGLFSLFIALILFLGFYVNENFVVYPLTALGVIAVIAGFIVFGFVGIIAIPVLGFPVLIGLWLVLTVMEYFPKVTVGAFVVIGVLLVLVDLIGDR